MRSNAMTALRGMTLMLVLALTTGMSGTAGAARQGPADVVFVGRFVTLDPQAPEVEAIAVRDGRITALGSLVEVASDIGPDTRRVQLAGIGLPGFADAHAHAEGLGEQLELLDLQRLSKQEILDRVAAAVRAAAPGAWVQGRGWDQGFWAPPEFPTRADLDRVAPDNPVLLTRIGGHSVWLDSRALELAGIDASTPDPDGGRIVRDEHGEPTGMLVDAAVDIAMGAVPPVTAEDRDRRLRLALDQYVRWGVTSLHDAAVSLEGIWAYERLLKAGELPIRVYVMALGEGPTREHILARGPRIDPAGRLTVRCFKAFLDGALGSRGAQLSAPYSDAPSETGLELMQDDAFAELIRRATERGFQVAAHAIGDRAVHRALDVYEAAGAATRALRPRIEHVSMVRPEDIPRFAKLGIVASMQPVFVGEYSRWALQRVGPERIEWVYPTRRIMETGAVVASGTDYPASDSGDPRATLYSLVTRKGADRKPDEGFLPDEAVDVDRALRTMTAGAAYAAFQEHDLGVLGVGRLADITVLSADPRKVPKERLLDLRVLNTIVGGEVVYAADGDR